MPTPQAIAEMPEVGGALIGGASLEAVDFDGILRAVGGAAARLFGDIELERATYQRSGRGRVAVPLELRLGIVEGAYTPRVARILTKAVALMPEAEAEDLLAEVGVANVSKSTLHRMPRAIASRYESRREIIERALRGRDPIPEGTVTIQVGLDGVMVPQDGEHARARGRKTDDPDPPRHEQRYGHVGPEPPSSKDGTLGRAWHEAAVGTVAFFDADGNRLKTTYLARMPEPFKATLCAGLEAEIRAVVEEVQSHAPRLEAKIRRPRNAVPADVVPPEPPAPERRMGSTKRDHRLEESMDVCVRVAPSGSRASAAHAHAGLP
jgi:hypothetical protein